MNTLEVNPLEVNPLEVNPLDVNLLEVIPLEVNLLLNCFQMTKSPLLEPKNWLNRE